jgi:hypothetical protein
MENFSNKTWVIIVITSLLLVVIYIGLMIPHMTAAAQAEASPTPTLIATNGQTNSSGDTEGLIIGAGIILFIILGGVILQRTILKSAEPNSR